MRDCICGCGNMECAVVCVAVGVWNARLCAWLWKYGMRDCVRGCRSMDCEIVCVAVGVLSARMHTISRNVC
jgi:hypothetical protein